MGRVSPDVDQEFREFVMAERASLLRFAVALTADLGLAEDLVQVALIKCYPRWAKIRSEAPGRYVRASVLNAHRSSRRRFWRNELPTAHVPDALAPVLRDAEHGGALLQALAALTARQREVVTLRFLEDLDERATAALLKISVGTVKSTTHDALQRLRKTYPLLVEAEDR